MIEFSITYDVITMLICVLVAVMVGVWLLSILVHKGKFGEFDGFLVAIGALATVVALIYAFALAINGGVS